LSVTQGTLTVALSQLPPFQLTFFIGVRPNNKSRRTSPGFVHLLLLREKAAPGNRSKNFSYITAGPFSFAFAGPPSLYIFLSSTSVPHPMQTKFPAALAEPRIDGSKFICLHFLPRVSRSCSQYAIGSLSEGSPPNIRHQSVCGPLCIATFLFSPFFKGQWVAPCSPPNFSPISDAVSRTSPMSKITPPRLDVAQCTLHLNTGTTRTPCAVPACSCLCWEHV